MLVKASLILIFLTIFLIINNVYPDKINCWYHEGGSSIFFERSTGYACELGVEDIDKYNDEYLSVEIIGTHEPQMYDKDVKLLGSRTEFKLRNFPPTFCQKFKNLEEIRLTSTIIEKFDGNSLKICENLKILQFFGNRLSRLPENLLGNNKKLTQFSISRNLLRTLPENIFAAQNDLEKLDLDSNKITNLPKNIFKSQTELKVLDLKSNQLKKLSPNWFKTLEKLEALVLSSNLISDLPKDVFKPLTALTELWLDGNKITVIHADSFNPDAAYDYLNFLKNNISAIDDKFIEDIDASKLWIENNICRGNASRQVVPEDEKFLKCFENYQPRVDGREEPETVTRPKPGRVPLTKTMERDDFECGKVMIGDGNIVGGEHAPRGAFPWNAALIRENGKYFCGGTLISTQKVVTAAHCIHLKNRRAPKFLPRDLSVLLGAHNLSNTYEIDRTSNAVRRIHLHPDWNPQTEDYDADIAVLILAQKVHFTNRIQPLCLGDLDSFIATTFSGIVVGYGKSEDDTKLHENVPKILNIPIHNDTTCFLKNYVLARFSSARTFCGGQGDGTGVCKGDSGSGVYVMINNVFYLRGIVSASLFHLNFNCDVDTYAIFTDALMFANWVRGIDVNMT